MSQYLIKLNEPEDLLSPAISPLKTANQKMNSLYPSLDSQRQLSSSQNLIELNENTFQAQLDQRYISFKELIEKRDAHHGAYTMSIDDQELVASVLHDFHHFKILIRSQRRLEFSIKLFKHIKIGYLERGEFFFHKGDSNKTDLICILDGKAAVYQKKSESFINQEMDLLGRIVSLNHQIVKIEKSAPTINNEMSKAIHQLKQRIEHTEDKLNLLRAKEEDDLLKAYNYQKYFLTENVCGFRRVKYAERGSTLAEAQVVNGCSCESTVVCISKCFYFYISSQAYREIFGLEITKNSFICSILKQNFPGAKDDSLRRVSYDFKEEIYEYNKVIFEENDPANVFMIVRQGEVEAVRRIDVQVNNPLFQLEQQQSSPLTPEKPGKNLLNNTKSTAFSPLTTPSGTSQFFNSSINIKSSSQQQITSQQQIQAQAPMQSQQSQNLFKRFKGKNTYKEISIGIIGEGQILGIEDAYNNKKTRSFKAISKTNETIIYYINKKQLDDVILLNDDRKLKKGIKNQSKHKSDYYDSRTDNLINFEQANMRQKENHILQENMKKQYLPESKNFKYLIQSWINQKHGPEESSSSLNQDTLAKYKQSIQTSPQQQLLNQKGEEDNNTAQQPTEQILEKQSSSPVKIPRRSQLKSLTYIQTTPLISEHNLQSEDVQQLTQQPTLESPPRKRRTHQKDCESLSPRKIALVQSISMPRQEEFLFKSDLDIINEHIEMKEQQIQYQQQQREKFQSLAQSPTLNSAQISSHGQQSTTNQAANGSSQSNINQHQSAYEQQQFEETKKRILFLKNFQNENKKNYRLKSEYSFLNSILKKTSSMKLDIHSIQHLKQQQNRGSINEIHNISQESEEASPTTNLILNKKNSLLSIGHKGSEIVSSPRLDPKCSERKSENICNNNLNSFHLPKQLSHLNNAQAASFNPASIKSLQNISQVSTITELNQHPIASHFSQNANTINNIINLQKAGISPQKQTKKQEANDIQNIYYNTEQKSEHEVNNSHHHLTNPTLHHIKTKSLNINYTTHQLHSIQPSSPTFFNPPPPPPHMPSMQITEHNESRSSAHITTSERKITIANNHLLANHINESETNTPSTSNNTPYQLPSIQSKVQHHSHQKDQSSQMSQCDDNTRQSLTINTNSIKRIQPSFSELPSISNRTQSTANLPNINFMNKQDHHINGMIKTPLSPSEGFTDIVKRIGLDPSQAQEQQKYQILKNLFKLSKKPKSQIGNNMKKQINNHPLIQQKSRKNLSAACSPRNNHITLTQSNNGSQRTIPAPPQLANFRNESPLIIGKINYAVK